ncbi:DUF4132 domain-containing protein [Streptomyces sp. NBC_01142]|uniref:DUF4132 domain-containing protein n=1 Tax=Streptomyces sp. NBC_01142 TaxID=2975865 RepID=UPI002251A69B|nr:DUF4132 domain-containing protein [Streptomyces sp. NBC_01142]MCX4818886.1 DUF4132 domain-containing protein [Streptomyces sp. NBC_01142]
MTDGLEARLYEAGWRERTGEGPPVRELLESLDEPEQRRAALWFHDWLCRSGDDDVTLDALGRLAEQRLEWTAPQAAELLGRLVGADAQVDLTTLLRKYVPLVRLALTAARTAGEYDRGHVRALRRWLPSAEDRPEWLREWLDELAGTGPETTGLSGELLDAHDDYGPAMRAAHPTLLAAPGIDALLWHCMRQDKVRATKRWRKEASALLDRTEGGAETVRALLEGMAAQPEHPVAAPQWAGDAWPGIAAEGSTRLVRGLLWAAAGLEADWVVPVVGEVALNAGTGWGGSGGYCRSVRMATTAVAVLGDFGGAQGEQAVDRLGRLQRTIRNRTVVKGIAASLQAVAERSGLTPSMLRERTVPSVGLDPRGLREEALGDYTAVLSVTASGAAALSFRGPQGRVLKSAPKAVRDEFGTQLSEIRGALKQLRALMPVERMRLEDHLMAGTRWATEDWEQYYIDPAVTGSLARTLIWEMSRDGGGRWTAGLPERMAGGWALAGADGTALPVTDGALLRLWHPVRADAEEIAAWREELAGRELRQPFKQAFREVYPLTPAEEETGSYSNRFAGHILRYNQAKALMVERGWLGNHLGYFSDGYSAEMVRELPRAGDVPTSEGEFWRARFYVELVDQPGVDRGTASLCSTDQVRFERRRGARGPWERAGLVDVPQPVLTEAMRDVDLFVGVASIGADPQWTDRGADRAYDGYWKEWAFGELTEPARIRRESLARLLPRTRIADRVELTDRFLRVRGELRAYKIHLGSGNILMEPNDAYLCIVVDRSTAAGSGERVFLPFEEDGGLLSVIMSKAFLLADDAQITDRTITAQIRRDA